MIPSFAFCEDQFLAGIRVELDKNKQVSILIIDNSERTDIEAALLKRFMHYNNFSIISRSVLAQQLQEMDLNKNSLYDSDTQLRIGKLLKASYLLVVYGSTDYNLIETATGKVVAAADYDIFNEPPPLPKRLPQILFPQQYEFISGYSLEFSGGFSTNAQYWMLEAGIGFDFTEWLAAAAMIGCNTNSNYATSTTSWTNDVPNEITYTGLEYGIRAFIGDRTKWSVIADFMMDGVSGTSALDFGLGISLKWFDIIYYPFATNQYIKAGVSFDLR
jgi:hypothetical protein